MIVADLIAVLGSFPSSAVVEGADRLRVRVDRGAPAPGVDVERRRALGRARTARYRARRSAS
jgi:hypothetical protein